MSASFTVACTNWISPRRHLIERLRTGSNLTTPVFPRGSYAAEHFGTVIWLCQDIPGSVAENCGPEFFVSGPGRDDQRWGIGHRLNVLPDVDPRSGSQVGLAHHHRDVLISQQRGSCAKDIVRLQQRTSEMPDDSLERRVILVVRAYGQDGKRSGRSGFASRLVCHAARCPLRRLFA